MSATAPGLSDTLSGPGHVGLFHDGEAEQRTWCADFVRPALEATDEGVMLFGAGEVSDRLLAQLEADVGQSVRGAVDGGRIVLARSDRDVSVHLENMVGACDELTSRGVRLVRAVAKVDWDVPGYPALEDELWTEWRLDQLLASRPVLMLCTYDLAVLPGEALIYGGLETHRSIVVAGRLSTNPSYAPEGRYLRERLRRLPWLT